MVEKLVEKLGDHLKAKRRETGDKKPRRRRGGLGRRNRLSNQEDDEKRGNEVKNFYTVFCY